MSKDNLNKQSTPPTLEKLELAGLVKVVVPDDVLQKIKYLCRSIAKVEWSGLLFYTVEGSIKDITNMKIILKDIFLMDKGTSGYTSFDWSGEEIVSYRIDNPESMDWLVGHIHSHNTMSVFFSGTDWSELNDNCTAHNYYLSMIVNNYMDMVAKIAFTADFNHFICKDEEGQDYELEITREDANPYMFVYDCELSSSAEELAVGDVFKDRVAFIETKSQRDAEEAERKRKHLSVTQNKQQNRIQNPVANKGFQDLRNLPTEDWGWPGEPDRNGQKFYSKTDEKFAREMGISSKSDKKLKFIPPEIVLDEEEDTPATIEEGFAAFILRLGNEIDDDHLEDALLDIDNSQISQEYLGTAVVDSYRAFYDFYFEKEPGFGTAEHYTEILEAVIELIKPEVEGYDWLEPILIGLTTLGMQTEEIINSIKTNN